MSRPLLMILSLSFGLVAMAQLETNYWFFGTRGGLDFSCHPPMPIVGVSHNIQEGCASISDAQGNFLFTTNGDIIWDRNFDPMPNGSGLSGKCTNYADSNTQPAIIIPDPASATQYYVFTTDCVEDTLRGGFRFSIVDMNANSGLGDVVLRDSLLYSPTCEKVTATSNDNGGFWVVSHEFGTNNFYAYQVTNSGISEPIISAAGQVHYYMPIFAPGAAFLSEQMGRGTLKFSPSGDKLIALATPDDSGYPNHYVLHPELFNFDKISGIVTSAFEIQHPESLAYYGAAFSPDGSKLYLSGGWYHPDLHQFDLSAGTTEYIINSRVLINGDYPSTNGAIALANDGKIYSTISGGWLNVIHSPDSSGIMCDFEYQGIMLRDCPEPVWSNWSLPNFMQSYFVSPVEHDSCLDHITAAFIYSGDCSEEPVQFIDQSTIFPETIQHWSWNFGDPASGAANYSNEPDPQHLFSEPGSYEVQLVVQTDMSPICKIDSITYTVVVQSCTPTDVGDFDLSSSFNVFPNPSDDEFNVSISTTAPIRLQLYDTSGKVIWEYAGSNKRIAFGRSLSAGLYILRVEAGDAVTGYYKVIKE